MAVKVLRADRGETLSSDSGREPPADRLLREARAAAALSHPTAGVVREPSGCVPVGVLVVGIGSAVFGVVVFLLGLAMFAPPMDPGDATTGWVTSISGGVLAVAGAAGVILAAVLLRRTHRMARIAAILSVAPEADPELVARELRVSVAAACELLATGARRRYWRWAGKMMT